MSSTEDKGWILDALQRYERPLTRYAHGILRDIERARDVVQDTFLKLCSQERERVEPHLSEWLFTVCRNRALDVIRKEGRMTTTDDIGLMSPERSPAANLEHEEAAQRALQLVDALPERQREVIRLKFQAGLSYKEISRITSHSVSYVGVLIHTGMKTLRDRLGALTPEA